MNAKKIASILFILLTFSFLAWQVTKDFDQIKSVNWNFSKQNTFLLFALSLTIPFFNVVSWHLMTLATGAKLKFFENLKIWTISNLARFLPGGIWQYPGRVLLAKEYGEPKTRTTSTIILEAILNLGVGTGIVFITSTFWPLPISPILKKFLIPLIGSIVLLLLALTNTKIVGHLMKQVAKLSKKPEFSSSVKISSNLLPIIVLSVLFQFVLAGGVLYFLASSVTPLPLSILIPLIGIFAAGWLAGYITVFAPAGLGVQELSISALLSLYMPIPVAGLVAVALRIILTLSELITVSVALFIRSNQKV